MSDDDKTGPTAADAEKTCRCGHTYDHYMVSPKCEYSGWGWFWVSFMGVSTRPVKASYVCRVCKEMIFETTDAKHLDRLI